jgi:hypothetical protein
MLPGAAFVSHAQFLEDPSGGGISPEVGGMDSIQIEMGEGKFQYRMTRLGAVPLPPVRPANPVSEFRPLEIGLDDQAYGPDQLVQLAQGDGENNLFSGFESGPMGENPFLGHSHFVRMGNSESGIRNRPISGQPSQVLPIWKFKGSKK